MLFFLNFLVGERRRQLLHAMMMTITARLWFSEMLVSNLLVARDCCSFRPSRIYMPLGRETIGISLNYIINAMAVMKVSLWNIISIIILYVLIQCIECWHHVPWASYFNLCWRQPRPDLCRNKYQDEIISVNSTNYYTILDHWKHLAIPNGFF